MYVTQHALGRLTSRMGLDQSRNRIVRMLEALPGQPGSVAYMVADSANGNIVIAVAIDGSVETIYFRRPTQDFSSVWFGSSKVVDLRPDDRDEPEYEDAWEDDGGTITRGELRSQRLDNGRKMKVSGRSVLLLSALSSGQQARRRQRRRKRGA